MSIKTTMTKYSFLVRIIITLLLLICIPMLIFTLSMTRRSYQDYQNSSEQLNLTNLNYYSEYFARQFEQMRVVASKIGYERKVTYHYATEKAYNVLEVMNILDNYMAYVPIVNRLAVYFGDDYLYANDGRVSLDGYASEMIGKSRYQKTEDQEISESETAAIDEFTTILQTFRGDYLFFSTVGKVDFQYARFYLVIPVVLDSRYSEYAMVVYEISRSTFQYNMPYGMFSDQVSFGLLDQQSHVLFSDNKNFNTVMNHEQMTRQLSETKSNTMTLSDREQEYAVYKIDNDKIGLSFVMLTSNSMIQNDLDMLYKTLKNSVVWVTGLFLLLCLASAYLSYRPIVKLVRRVINADNAADARRLNVQNEIQTIYTAFEGIASRNDEMRRIVFEQKAMLLENALNRLLEGSLIEKGEMERLHIDLSGPHFCVMITPAPDMRMNSLEQLALEITRQCEFQVYTVDVPNTNEVAFIFNIPGTDRTIREQCAAILKQTLAAQGCKIEKIGVGSAVSKIADIRISFLTATSSYENDLNQKTVFFEDVVDTFKGFENYPSESVLKFIQFVKQGDKANAIGELDLILAEINLRTPSLIMQQYFFFNIFDALIKSLTTLDIVISTEEIGLLMQNNGSQKFRGILIDFIEKKCDKIMKVRHEEANNLTRNILQYIEQNYTNSYLGLSTLADEFDLPVYTISRLFKKVTHAGFNEYVNMKRIEFSKTQLLLYPEKGMKDIAVSSGFNDVSYFIKIFKSSCGFTPKQFRQI